jgi:hypothetical protein
MASTNAYFYITLWLKYLHCPNYPARCHKLMGKFRKVNGKYNCSHNETAMLEAGEKQLKLNTTTVTRSTAIKVTEPKSEILSNSPH